MYILEIWKVAAFKLGVSFVLCVTLQFAYATHLGDIKSNCLMPSLPDSFSWNLILVHLYVGSFSQYLQMRNASLSLITFNHEESIAYRKGYLPRTKLSLLILTNKELLTRSQLTRAFMLTAPRIALSCRHFPAIRARLSFTAILTPLGPAIFSHTNNYEA